MRMHASRRARVLFLGCHLPFPAHSGGRRRELELIRRLGRRFEVHLMVVSKTYEEDVRNARELERHCARVEVFPADPLPDGLPRASQPRQVLRHRAPGLTARVEQVLARGEVDLVHVEGYYLVQHLPERPGVPVLLVEQNIEYDLERQRAAGGRRAHDMRTHRAEVEAWRRADVLGVLTPEDREMLLDALPGARVRLVPDGADHLPRRAPGDPRAPRSPDPLVVFLANFGYEPNVDATDYLCDDVLPLLRERVPGLQLWLVGNDPPPEVAARAGDGVRVTGRVPDVVPYIDAADVVACPLRVGGGMKVKAIEALRRGKCVVSSSVGVQGMPPRARAAIAIADDAESFAESTARLLRDPALRATAERRSARAAGALPTWAAAAEAVAGAWGELLEPGLAAAAGGAL